MTWGEVGGTIGKWREHKKDNYDGLFEVGCVTNELIPKVIKETNTAIRMEYDGEFPLYQIHICQTILQVHV
jgi:hypothetical protein